MAIGYSAEDKQCGPVGYQMCEDGGGFEPTKLLYPVEQKNYTDDEFISIEWERVKAWMAKESVAVWATIFGYGALVSDVEAVSLHNGAWGTLEQFEIIDITPEAVFREHWNGFIHSHHYDIVNSYFDSSLGNNSRRTSESYFSHYQSMTPK